MLRQRLHSRGSRLRLVGRILVVLLALALIWYGLMIVLLAVGIAPKTVNLLSGYRSAFDYLAGLDAQDISPLARAIAAGAGLLAFLVFGYLAFKEPPRPYLARGDIDLVDDERGTVVVEPRAIERAAELAALEHGAVSAAAGRFGDELKVAVTVSRARDLHETLDDVGARVAAALERHGIPPAPVQVTLTGFDRKQRRELN